MKKESRKNSINSKRLIVLFLGIAAILIFISLFFLWSRPLETRVLPVKFIVGDRLGMNLNVSEINFGIAFPDNDAIRNVVLENKYSFPITVRLFVSKNLEKYVLADNNIKIMVNETKIISFHLSTKGLEFGNYSGQVKFEIRKAKG
jgi:hypothetical protein